MTTPSADSRTPIALVVMIVTPLCFSSNLIFGRHVVGDVPPFTLAFLRWACVALALAPFALREAAAVRAALRAAPGLIALLGFLGMWICGAVVYLGLRDTTATNATLIYTTSPVFILAIEAVTAGRRIGAREIAGSIAAMIGVAVIVTRGDLGALARLDINPGDALILGAAFSWAIYSVLYRSPPLRPLSNLTLFALVSAAGAIGLAPFAAWELAGGDALPQSTQAWISVAGIVVIASLMAFSGFQYGVRTLGPSLTGIFMYLLPVYGVVLAILFLGERFEAFHGFGIAMVLGGVVLATFPAGRLRRRSAELAERGKRLKQPIGK